MNAVATQAALLFESEVSAVEVTAPSGRIRVAGGDVIVFGGASGPLIGGGPPVRFSDQGRRP